MQSKITEAEGFDFLIFKIKKVFGEREARSIAKIVFEDFFKIKNVSPKNYLSLSDLEKLEQVRSRLAKKEPIQHITGQADFYGYKFHVNPSVLIPRQETEELVEWVITSLENQVLPKDARILDIGTGSGCIPISLANKMPGLQLTAVDISETALQTAQTNAQLHKAKIRWIEFDILNYDHWNPREKWNAIISNPPYIPKMESNKVAPWVKKYEPKIALFVENENPLKFYKAIIQFSKKHLLSGGCIFFECNEFNIEKVAHLLTNNGFSDPEIKKDIRGRERMIKATML